MEFQTQIMEFQINHLVVMIGLEQTDSTSSTLSAWERFQLLYLNYILSLHQWFVADKAIL